MREILFRGQTRRYGEKVRIGDGKKLPSRWVFGGVLQGSGAYSVIYGGENVDDPCEGLDKWTVYTDTLCQYTGLKDKHGKRIFEGDLLKPFYDSCDIMVVVFRDGEFQLSLYGERYTDECGWSLYSYGDDVEIIGNRYDT